MLLLVINSLVIDENKLRADEAGLGRFENCFSIN